MKNVVFYAGSFDPFTIGHLELIKQASVLFSKVIVGIGINPEKERRYNKEQMKQAIIETLQEEKIFNCSVVIYEGYTFETAKTNGSKILIRGLRNETDYIYEEQIAKFNDQYDISTIYLRAGQYGNISSSFVYNELKKGNDISNYVPNSVKKLILKK